MDFSHLRHRSRENVVEWSLVHLNPSSAAVSRRWNSKRRRGGRRPLLLHFVGKWSFILSACLFTAPQFYASGTHELPRTEISFPVGEHHVLKFLRLGHAVCGPKSLASRAQVTLVMISFEKKSLLSLPNYKIIKAWFSSINYKIGYLVSLNYQNRLLYIPRWFHKRFCIFFIIFCFLSLFSLNWGSKRGSKIMKISIAVEKST